MNQYKKSINVGLNINIIIKLFEHLIIPHSIEIENLIIYSSQKRPVKIDGIDENYDEKTITF